jgi:hypothetical protein
MELVDRLSAEASLLGSESQDAFDFLVGDAAVGRGHG